MRCSSSQVVCVLRIHVPRLSDLTTVCLPSISMYLKKQYPNWDILTGWMLGRVYMSVPR